MDMNKVIRYFDLQSERRQMVAKAQGAGGGQSAPVLPQYLALILGIIIEPFLHHYTEHGAWSIDLSTVIGRIIFGVIIGAIVFPGVYKSAFDPSKPLFVQLCAVFSAGIGWQSLIEGGSKLTGIS
jgi:hypothetical protein